MASATAEEPPSAVTSIQRYTPSSLSGEGADKERMPSPINQDAH